MVYRVGKAKGLQSRYLGDIREKARTLDVSKVLAEVGKWPDSIQARSRRIGIAP